MKIIKLLFIYLLIVLNTFIAFANEDIDFSNNDTNLDNNIKTSYIIKLNPSKYYEVKDNIDKQQKEDIHIEENNNKSDKNKEENNTDEIVYKSLSRALDKDLLTNLDIVKKDDEIYLVTVDNEKSLEQLQESLNEEIIYIEENKKRSKLQIDNIKEDAPSFSESNLDDLQKRSWAVSKIKAYNTHDAIETDGEIIIAVVDTGVDYNHEYLKDNVMQGYDFWNEDYDPIDDDGHGTHVAGIIAMTINPYKYKIMPIKVLDSNGDGDDYTIARGIRYAVDNNANIINLSLGGEGYSRTMKDAIDYAISNNVLVVCASGNENEDIRNFYPANFKDCITVGATTVADQRWNYSNYGDNLDITAPGRDIISSVPDFADIDSKQDGYTYYDGTSMAAPFVAGALALLLKINKNASSAQIEDELYKNTLDLGPLGKDIYYGYGRIDFTNFKVVKEYNIDVTQSIDVLENEIALNDSYIDIKLKNDLKPIVKAYQNNKLLEANVVYENKGLKISFEEELNEDYPLIINLDDKKVIKLDILKDQNEFEIVENSNVEFKINEFNEIDINNTNFKLLLLNYNDDDISNFIPFDDYTYEIKDNKIYLRLMNLKEGYHSIYLQGLKDISGNNLAFRFDFYYYPKNN
ncbi:S8 family serine peptidase [Peptostreptococcaceae bacterium AGR-M142]